MVFLKLGSPKLICLTERSASVTARLFRLSLKIRLDLRIRYQIKLTNNLHLLIQQFFAGVFSREVTPVPIPNTEVKLSSGDGIAGLLPWESSTMPAFIS